MVLARSSCVGRSVSHFLVYCFHFWLLIYGLNLHFGHLCCRLCCISLFQFWGTLLCYCLVILIYFVMVSCDFLVINQCRWKGWVGTVVFTGVITIIIAGWFIIRIIIPILINDLFVQLEVAVVITIFNLIVIPVGGFHFFGIVVGKGINVVNCIIWHGLWITSIKNNCSISMETIKIAPCSIVKKTKTMIVHAVTVFVCGNHGFEHIIITVPYSDCCNQ